MRNHFHREFSHVSHILRHATNVLLVAHTRPDPDAVGSVVALKEYIESNYNADVTLACFSPFPLFLYPVLGDHVFSILDSSQLELESFDVAIGCDSVDRGFADITTRLDENCISIVFDHHHDINLQTDISIIDPTYASTTELLYAYFTYDHGIINEKVATALLTGIIGDTGIFQHSNTSPEVLSVSADLVKRGASVSRIVRGAFANQKVSTLNLWGKALERATLNKETGFITTVLTENDIMHGNPTSEELKEVATILVNAPSVKVAIIFLQISRTLIKASLRANKDADVDVSEIAHAYGGGGHPLAAGFEMKGKISLLPRGGWHIT